MKKIKYLLGLLIVGAGLFINQSFGQLAVVDYVSTGNKNLTFYLGADFNDVSTPALQRLSYSYFGSSGYSFDYLNFGNYSYYTGSIFSSLGSHGFFHLYGSNKNLALVLSNRNSSTSNSVGNFLYYRLGGQSSFTSSDLISGSDNNFYLSILGNNSYDNCFSVNTPLEGFCNPIWYNIHFRYKSYTLTDVGLLEDGIFPYSGQLLSGDKSAVVYSLYNTYSFFSEFYNNHRDLGYFRTVYRKSDGTFDYINGAMFMRLNNNDPVLTGQNFQIIGITPASGTLNTGGLIFDYYYNSDNEFYSLLNSQILKYSLYTCPYNSRSVFDCTFNKGGVLTTGSLTNSVYLGFLRTIYTLYDGRRYVPKIIVGYNSELNYISLDGIYYADGVGHSSSVVTTYFYLGSNDGYNMLDGITPPDDPLPPIPDDPDYPEDSTYSGSVVFDNCVETEVCWYSTGSDGLTTKYCTNSCVSSGAIESGSYVGPDGTIYYVDSTLDIGNLINGNTSYLFNTGYLDSDGLLSVDYYSGLFNGGGFKLGVCPYPKSEFFSFVTNIKIGGFYPFMPINCFYSAFIQGFKIHYFDDFGLFPNLNSQLINGNTHFHKTLYRFFDILLSIGLLLILTSLYRMIKK